MDGSGSASKSFGPSFTASQPSAVSIALQTAVLSPTFLANLLGNISVCLVICGMRSLRQRPSSSILASLAMSDFSLLAFLLFRLIWLYDFEAANKVCEHFATLLTTLLYVSIGHICLLSCDRYIAIIYPLRYAEIVTRTRVILALLVAWITPSVSMVVLPALFYDGNKVYSQLRTSTIGCSESTVELHSWYKAHIALNGTLFVVIPFVVTIFVYGRIAKISWFQSSRIEPGENLNPQTAKLRRRKRKEMKWMKTTGNYSPISLNGTLNLFCYYS